MRASRDPDPPVRITTAAPAPGAGISARQRRYLISMSLRAACFIGAILIGDNWLRWVLVAGALVLPYVAVVLANAPDKREEGFALQGAPAFGELGGRKTYETQLDG